MGCRKYLSSPVIYPDFFFDLTWFFGEALTIVIQVLANKMQDFWNFVLHNCILIFDTEQAYLKDDKASSHHFQE